MVIEIGLKVDRLRQLREKRGWSQRELARRCGFSEAMIRKYESEGSDPSASALQKIANQLNVSTDYLLGIAENPQDHYQDEQINNDESFILETFRREGWAGVARVSVEKLSEP